MDPSLFIVQQLTPTKKGKTTTGRLLGGQPSVAPVHLLHTGREKRLSYCSLLTSINNKQYYHEVSRIIFHPCAAFGTFSDDGLRSPLGFCSREPACANLRFPLLLVGRKKGSFYVGVPRGGSLTSKSESPPNFLRRLAFVSLVAGCSKLVPLAKNNGQSGAAAPIIMVV